LALLLKLPAIPNCPSIFWPTASASLRLYCGQLAANKRTVGDLLEAIALINSLPDDHPMRPEVNRNIEMWSLTILDLAEEAFQQGKLQDAIDTTNQIPSNTSARHRIKEQVQRWKSIWAEAEKIYQDAEKAMIQQDLPQAFRIAVHLLSVGNTYWETTKYQELTNLLTDAREDGNKLARARRLADQERLSNFLDAIKLVEEVKPNSPAYTAAQRLMVELGKDMMASAEATLEEGDANAAIAIARQIPEKAGLRPESQDFIMLAMARAQAWGGTVADLESAIIQAQRLDRDRPLYDRAQTLISRWQLEIQDVNRLEIARQLAEPGGIADLSAAIAEAELIPAGNPRAHEAQADIDRWTAKIQTMEDQPYLDQADQWARGGDINSLQAAINEASRIREGRALYDEARRRIRDWTRRIQRTQDQPYLDQARQLAAAGNLPAAIATAQHIQSGRALYEEAQADIRAWQAQTEGQARLQDAYSAASIGTYSTLLQAIRTAEQVPNNSPARTEADRMINLWSQQILEIAQRQAVYDLEGAIAIASTIPPRTEAYAQAQLQIQTWRNPIPTPDPPPPDS
jgi:soluble cytochrome b562